MDDVSLRHEFHRALDAVAPPAPYLRYRIHEELQRRRQEERGWSEPGRRAPVQLAWLLPVVAMLLAIALIVTVIAAHLLGPRPIPVVPHSGAALTCSTWGYVDGGGGAPVTLKMTSPTTGWAPGDLRTTDGGVHWTDVSPPQLRSDEPYLPGQQSAYPPNYTDFFLDDSHAWLVRSYSSQDLCVDHLVVFSTSDGGVSWRASHAISPHMAANAQPGVAISFLDSRQGWLLVSEFSTRQSKLPRFSIVFHTSDGGQSWKQISTQGPPCGSFEFSSAQLGWSACANNGMWKSLDGGVTWVAQPQMSSAICCPSLPIFFDAMHAAGALAPNSNGGVDAAGNPVPPAQTPDIYSTSDGGLHWKFYLVSALGNSEQYPEAIDFAGIAEFWALVAPPGSGKGYTGPSGDWLYHSGNGGASWQLVQTYTPITGPTELDFIDSEHGFVLEANPNGSSSPPTLLITSDGGHHWSGAQVQVTPAVLKQGTSGSDSKSASHGSVYFVSPEVAWELSLPPDQLRMAIFRTVDGGAHWNLWGIAPEQATPLGFTSDEVVLNDSVNLLSSSDGSTWVTHPLPEQYSSLSFLPDLLHGWAYGALPTQALPTAKGGPPQEMGVWATQDGGASWRLVARGYLGDGSGTIAFWSATRGAILQGATLYLSSNGGATWRKTTIGGPLPAGASMTDAAPVMFDATHGVLPMVGGGSAQYVSQTSDGGLSWSNATLACPNNCELGFFDGEHWLAGSSAPASLSQSSVSMSADAGLTWQAVTTTNPVAQVSAIEVIPGAPGYAVVLVPGVYASETTDYGLHWKAVGLVALYPSFSGIGGGGGWVPPPCNCGI